MKLQDAIDTFEDNFTCELGAFWRWADLGMTKPYQKLEFDQDVTYLHSLTEIEHRLVARMVTNILKLKSSLGFTKAQKPKLFWRWRDKIRIEDNTIVARFYIDGCPGGGRYGNPDGGGAPVGGQIRLVKDSDQLAQAA